MLSVLWFIYKTVLTNYLILSLCNNVELIQFVCAGKIKSYHRHTHVTSVSRKKSLRRTCVTLVLEKDLFDVIISIFYLQLIFSFLILMNKLRQMKAIYYV